MKILLAEDNVLLLKTLKFKLEKEGYEVVSCIDGNEALKQIEEQKPDLIVTDIMMPYANGLDIVNKTRKVFLQDTPIIVLSSVGLEKTVLEAFQLGADDYITKPFSPNELLIRIKKLTKPRN